MAEIEVGALLDRLAEEEIAELARALEEIGVPRMAPFDDSGSVTISTGIDDDLLSEFLDRLEAHDIACEVYLPAEFDSRVEVGELRVGSAVNLLEVLEGMKDELAILDDEDEDEDEDEEEAEDYASDLEMVRGELRSCWRLFYLGAQKAVERHLALHIRP